MKKILKEMEESNKNNIHQLEVLVNLCDREDYDVILIKMVLHMLGNRNEDPAEQLRQFLASVDNEAINELSETEMVDFSRLASKFKQEDGYNDTQKAATAYEALTSEKYFD